MKNPNFTFYDIVVAKEYETKTGDQTEKKTTWYRVGRAWPSKSSESLNLELYLIPGQRYVINMKPKANMPEDTVDFSAFQETTL